MNCPQLPNPTTQHAGHQVSGGFVFMPEEDDFEPDSRECQLTDKLIEALMFGKRPLAAFALREISELDGEALKSLALLLEDQALDPSNLGIHSVGSRNTSLALTTCRPLKRNSSMR